MVGQMSVLDPAADAGHALLENRLAWREDAQPTVVDDVIRPFGEARRRGGGHAARLVLLAIRSRIEGEDRQRRDVAAERVAGAEAARLAEGGATCIRGLLPQGLAGGRPG